MELFAKLVNWFKPLFFANSIKVCSQILFGRGLCRENKSIGWFRYGSGFRWGYFRTDYSTVLFSEAAIENCPSIIIPVARSFLVGLQTVSLQFYLSMSSSAGVFMFFVCIYFTGASFNDCFRSVYFSESLSAKEEFNFGSFF